MKARNWTFAVAILAMALVPVTASAQEPADSDGAPTTYEFERDDVEGSLAGPSEERVRGALPDELRSLIDVRSDFLDRLQSSVSDI